MPRMTWVDGGPPGSGPVPAEVSGAVMPAIGFRAFPGPAVATYGKPTDPEGQER